MANWITITEADVRAAGNDIVVDRAKGMSVDGLSAVDWAISGATARVRRAVSTGNALDADPTKVPLSLKDVTARAVYYALVAKVRLKLTADEIEQRKNDNSDLLRITDKGIPVEKPDIPGGSAEMQTSSTITSVNAPRRQTGRGRCSGL